MNFSRVFIAFGANLPIDHGEKSKAILAGLDHLQAHAPLKIDSLSSFYESPAWPDPSKPGYLNGVCAALTEASPSDLLAVMQATENWAGRVRDPDNRNADRPLDLDMIAFDDRISPSLAVWQSIANPQHADTGNGDRIRVPEPDLVLPDLVLPDLVLPDLVLPHPRAHQRAFVLKPLAEIAADWVHPVLNKDAAGLRDMLPESDLAAVRVWGRRPE